MLVQVGNLEYALDSIKNWSWGKVLTVNFILPGANLDLYEISIRSIGLTRSGAVVKQFYKNGSSSLSEKDEIEQELISFYSSQNMTSLIKVLFELGDLRYYQFLLKKRKSDCFGNQGFYNRVVKELDELVDNYEYLTSAFISNDLARAVQNIKYYYRFLNEEKNPELEEMIAKYYLDKQGYLF